MKRPLNAGAAIFGAFAAVLTGVVLVAPVQAQTSVSAKWSQLSSAGPAAREGASLSYDTARGQTVLFGGGAGTPSFADTWVFGGNTWTQLPVTGPSARYLAPMVYDSAREVSVLFGGYGAAGYLGDTWEWNGSAWSQRFTAHTPPTRDWSAMAYDGRRHVIVLFGGTGGSGLLNDTWEYDGTDWAPVTTAHVPAPRRGHALAFDSARGKVVLFGGQADGEVDLNDTWEYDGTDWTQVSLSIAPQARLWHSMAFDSALGGVVVFGGDGTGYAPLNDSWIYDGVSWQEITSSSPPSDRIWAPAVYDAADSDLELFGGAQNVDGAALGDTWALSGTNTLPVNWEEGRPATAPAARVFESMDYDSARGVTVLFGGSASAGPATFQDTWEWDGFNWTQRTPATSPPALEGAMMAYDSRRHVSVLFGGLGGSSGASSATWEWDGTNWTQKSLLPSPSPQGFGAMTYDSTRGVMLFFGASGNGLQPQTWEYDGSAWTQMSPAISPSARMGAAMAFDSVRGRIVLFGGRDSSGNRLADTWEWDGFAWSQIPASTTPYARFWSSMAFDSQRGRTVLFGGDHIQPAALGPTNDTWDWDGSQWTRDWTGAAPAVRAGQAMSFDSARDRMVLFGGYDAGTSPATFYGDTWELGTGVMTTAGSAAATVVPTGREFGSVAIASTSLAAAVDVVSSGTGPLVATLSTTGDFAISSTDCPSSPNPLAAGSTCVALLTFSPTAAGDRYGDLVLTGNMAGGSISIPLHGVGVQIDFSMSASPASFNYVLGGPNLTSTISTSILGTAGNITLSAQTGDPGVTATFSPPSITAGSGSVMTIAIASSVAPGQYGITVVGTEGGITHSASVFLNVVAPSDFSIAVSPSSLSMAQGSNNGALVSTSVVGSPGTISLSATVTPSGPTAMLVAPTIAAGNSSQLNVSVGYGVAPGTYTVTVTGVEGSFTHQATLALTVTLKGIVNGGFETGDLSGWTQTGVAAAVPNPHTGGYAGQIGSASASDTSSLAQTFTVPASGGKLTFWYLTSCSDKVKYDWFTVALVDGVTGATSTVLSPVCMKNAGWTKVTVNLSGHVNDYVTITFVNHDDGVAATPTFTLIDDVALS